jgi:hypothetical protein
MRIGFIVVAVGIGALLGIIGCSSEGGLDVSGAYSALLAVDGLTTPVAHTVALGEQGSGYWLRITPGDGTVPGALTFDSSSSARAAVSGGSHILAMVMNGPGSIGTYRDATGTEREITSGTIDLSFAESALGESTTESTSGEPELTAVAVHLRSADGDDYTATLAPSL